jgi:mRNA interferase HigB
MKRILLKATAPPPVTPVDTSQIAKYIQAVHIVTIKRLMEASEKHREAAQEIGAWVRIVKSARWRNFSELRASFPDADDVDGFVVFNIRHNRYRLIVAVHYAKMIEGRLTLGHVYIGSFMTHKEHDRWCAATETRRAEWLRF